VPSAVTIGSYRITILGTNNFIPKANATIEDIDITTVINFNRELFTSNKAMRMQLKIFLLQGEPEADSFNEIQYIELKKNLALKLYNH
jgi:hypothetical protein